MKKLMFIVMAALTMAAACSKAYDDSDLQKRLDKVESEIGSVKAALEEVGYDGVLCVELDNPEICNFHSAQVSREYIRNVLKL